MIPTLEAVLADVEAQGGVDTHLARGDLVAIGRERVTARGLIGYT